MNSILVDDDRPSTHPPARAGRTARSVGSLVVASLIAVGGIAAALWSVGVEPRGTASAERPRAASDTVSDRAPVAPGPSNVARAAAAPAAGGMPDASVMTTADVTFQPVADEVTAARTVASLAESVRTLTSGMTTLSNSPLQTADQIAGAVQALLRPLFDGSFSDPAGFVVANGGSAAEVDKVGPTWTKIARLLTFCEIDLSRAKVERISAEELKMAAMLPKAPAGSVMMRMFERRGDAGSTSTLQMPLEGLLPGSADEIAEQAPRVKLLVPARLKAEAPADQPLTLGVALVRNNANRWVPTALEFHAQDRATARKLQELLRVTPASRPPSAG